MSLFQLKLRQHVDRAAIFIKLSTTLAEEKSTQSDLASVQQSQTFSMEMISTWKISTVAVKNAKKGGNNVVLISFGADVSYDVRFGVDSIGKLAVARTKRLEQWHGLTQ